ncbi:hypothetical protein EIP86_007342 [Pleurotus ostreatoroseus]|nr:hypothetical protein EIP86_007342 [Pleurotus ostreatoroseus]
MPAREPPDPLDAVLRPPPDEPPAARAARLAREAEALRVSNEIDEQIKRERVLRRKKQVVRLLLLGQSESGARLRLRFVSGRATMEVDDIETCVLWATCCPAPADPPLSLSLARVEFQRLYTPSAFRDERPLWRAVIQLNVVRSIRTILDALAAAFASPPSSSSASSPHAHNRALASVSRTRARSMSSASASDSSDDADTGSAGPSTSMKSRSKSRARLPAHLEALAMRLLPLRHIEALLIARLVPPGEAEPTHFGLTGGGGWGGGWSDAGSERDDGYANGLGGGGSGGGAGGGGGEGRRHHEVFVRPGASWKAVPRSRARSPSRSPMAHVHEEAEEEDEDEGQAVLDALREDMCALWADAGVREVLRRGKVRVEEGPGL